MKRTLRLAATGVAVIFASATVANAFQLETKGTSAKWRTDIVKKNNAYTSCILKAWNACENAASVAKTGTWGLDCDVSVRPVVGDTATAGATNIANLNKAIGLCEAKVSGTAAKVGLSFLKPKTTGTTEDPLINLADIGCPGDCSTAEGSQPCADVEAWEVATVDPLNNSFKTALSLGGNTSLVSQICAQDDCLVGGTPPASLLLGFPAAVCTRPGTKAAAEGTTVNKLAKGVITYTGSVTSCVQKCQDDLGTKAGGGYYDDGTACNIPAVLDTTNPFQLCVSKAQAIMAKATTALTEPSCHALNAYTRGLVDKAITAATGSSYDRVDLQTLYLVEAITDSTNPFFVTSNATVQGLVGGLSDRVPAPGSRTSFGTSCPTANDGLLEDYEECDGTVGNNSLCGIIPGTKAGACPTADNAIAQQSTGRCPRL